MSASNLQLADQFGQLSVLSVTLHAETTNSTSQVTPGSKRRRRRKRKPLHPLTNTSVDAADETDTSIAAIEITSIVSTENTLEVKIICKQRCNQTSASLNALKVLVKSPKSAKNDQNFSLFISF